MRGLLWALALLSLWPANAFADPADAVVKIVAWTNFPEPTRPWAKGKATEGSGSGVIIEGKRILTNAHVVLYASDVYIQQRPGGEKYEAKVEFIARDIDLALLTVNDPKFFDNKTVLKRSSKLARAKDPVTVYGFPVGGAEMSITQGEVSRVNSKSYYRQGTGLELQVSAPINPGNSGGPAVSGDSMIGVVYSRLNNAQNIGFIIPCEEVDYFLEDIKDGKYDGKPREITETVYQPLENDAMRKMLNVDRSVKGVVVIKPSPGFPLKEFDVVTKIGSYELDNTGLIQLDAGLRVFFLYAVPKLAKNGSVPVTIIRDGKTMKGTIPGDTDDIYLIKSYHGEPLPYFVHGTFVFVPARSDDFNIYKNINRRLQTVPDSSPLMTRQNARAAFPGEELVVVSVSFPHKITKGYLDAGGHVVSELNGIRIKNLVHLVETIKACKDEYLKFRFADSDSDVMILPRQEFEEVTLEVLEDNGVPPARRGSPEIMKVWKQKK